MLNKIINLQKHVRKQNDDGTFSDIAYLSSQIGDGYGNFVISVQITNKENATNNMEYFKSEYKQFEVDVKSEAVKSGWNIF